MAFVVKVPDKLGVVQTIPVDVRFEQNAVPQARMRNQFADHIWDEAYSVELTEPNC